MISDPGGASAMAAMLQRTSRQVSAQADAVRTSYADLRDSWVGPAAIGAMRRADAMADALEQTAAAMTAAAGTLQRHAVALADTAAARREVLARADAAGWVVDDFGVRPAPGIRGVADAGHLATQQAERAELEEQWHQLTTAHTQLRTALLQALDPSRLAAISVGLRSG